MPTDWYKNKQVQKFIDKYDNPNFKKIHIAHPARILIIGSSGSGKTTCLLEFIKLMSNTYDHMILCVKDSSEPLYKYLIHKLGNLLQVYEGGKLPTIDEVKDVAKTGQTLIVFDDLVLEKNQPTELFIRGRKIGKGCSLVYISQSYYKVPKTIRINCDTLILKKLSTQRDLRMILSDYDLGKTKDELLKLYEEATKNRLDSFVIRMSEPSDSIYKYTKNFDEPI